jgi:tetratricopeptide (TPR) repeat protein
MAWLLFIPGFNIGRTSIGSGKQMARRQYGKQFVKIFAAIALLFVTVIGFSYASVLRDVDQATEEFSRGDPGAALTRYENIEQSLRSIGALRVIPTRDRRNLLLNQARLLYALGRYDDAEERLNREAEMGGTSNDGRFLLLKGEITFRKAMKGYRESSKKDLRLLEEALHATEDTLHESLRLNPSDWDAKYDFEYVNYIRSLMNQDQQGKIKILMENVRVEQQRPAALPPDLSR